ncbi:MAG: ABC transporter ATP-binding protein [Patescibacteria group bacterium]|jgi:putative ABC transport system ATP-binding protein
MVLYTIKNVTKIFGEKEAKVVALDHINLEIPQGQFIVILGASGSGKSTLLNILGGMDQPTAGEVLFKNKKITNYNRKELTNYRKKHIGFVFQSYNLLPNLTALENVEFSTEIAKFPKIQAKQTLQLVKLDHRLHHYPSELSGGEQQRISIARALAKNPEVLLCDEPTGALDYKTGINVLEVLHHIHEDGITSVIVITHNQDIAKIADFVIKMKSGQVVEIYKNKEPLKPTKVKW